MATPRPPLGDGIGGGVTAVCSQEKSPPAPSSISSPFGPSPRRSAAMAARRRGGESLVLLCRKQLRRCDVVRFEKRKLRQQLLFARTSVEVANQMLYRGAHAANDRLAAVDGGVGGDAGEERAGGSSSHSVERSPRADHHLGSSRVRPAIISSIMLAFQTRPSCRPSSSSPTRPE